jgi:hypothetical protein
MSNPYLVQAIALKPLLSNRQKIEVGQQFETTQQRLESFMTIGAAELAKDTSKQDVPTPADEPAIDPSEPELPEPRLSRKAKKPIPKRLGIDPDANPNPDPAPTVGDKPAI